MKIGLSLKGSELTGSVLWSLSAHKGCTVLVCSTDSHSLHCPSLSDQHEMLVLWADENTLHTNQSYTENM